MLKIELSKIELLIFDWSGTISDDRLPVYKANLRIREHLRMPALSFRKFIYSSAASLTDFLEEQKIESDPEEINLLYKRYLNEAGNEGIKPIIYPDALESIKDLHKKGKLLTVLSSHPQENLENEARSYDIAQYFSLIKGDEKNKAEAIKRICLQLKTNQKSTLYVGDTIFDIRSAKMAGVRSIAISQGYHTKEQLEKEQPSAMINSLSDLLKLF